MSGCLDDYFLSLCHGCGDEILFFKLRMDLLLTFCTFVDMKGDTRILEVLGMTVAYGDNVVIDDFSMFLKSGEMVAVTGVSGSGKSSLLRAVLGFVMMDAGEIRVDGNVVNGGHLDVLRHRVAYVPQDLSFPCESVREVMEIPFAFKCNRQRRVTPDIWDDVLLRLGLDKGIVEKRLNEISGGQKQRLMLAVAAMLDKDMVFLDEPTSALDAHSAALVIDFLKGLALSGKAVLAVTHDRNFAAACDRVIEITAK